MSDFLKIMIFKFFNFSTTAFPRENFLENNYSYIGILNGRFQYSYIGILKGRFQYSYIGILKGR